MSSHQNPLVSNIIVERSIDRIINSFQNIVVSKKYSPAKSIFRLESIKYSPAKSIFRLESIKEVDEEE